MSHQQNTEWLEAAYENFRDAVEVGNIALAKDIIQDTIDNGFSERRSQDESRDERTYTGDLRKKRHMNVLLLAISWLIIGFTFGFLATEYFLVRPMKKMRDEAMAGWKSAISLSLDILGMSLGIHKFGRNEKGDFVSPLSDLFKKREE